MRPRALAVALSLALALLIAILAARRTRDAAAERPGGKASTPPESPASPAARAASSPGTAAADPARDVPAPLPGLRPLSAEEIAARGLKKETHPWVAWRRSALAALKPWSEVSVSFSFTDTPLAEVIAYLLERYHLLARLDPSLATRDITVTFRVEDLAADQALDLILKMADLRYSAGADGALWIMPAGQAASNEPEFAAEMAAFDKERADALRRHRPPTWERENGVAREKLAKIRISPSIVRQPLDDALATILADDELRCWLTREAREATLEAPPVTCVGDDKAVGEALTEVLEPLGLAWRVEYGSVHVKTRAQAEEDDAQAAQAAEAEALERAEVARLRARIVRIQGGPLTVEEVAKQIGDQLGVRTRVDVELWERPSWWTGGGAPQTAGEVLDALAAAAPLTWDWVGGGQFVDGEFTDAGRTLWLFAKPEPPREEGK